MIGGAIMIFIEERSGLTVPFLLFGLMFLLWGLMAQDDEDEVIYPR